VSNSRSRPCFGKLSPSRSHARFEFVSFELNQRSNFCLFQNAGNIGFRRANSLDWEWIIDGHWVGNDRGKRSCNRESGGIRDFRRSTASRQTKCCRGEYANQNKLLYWHWFSLPRVPLERHSRNQRRRVDSESTMVVQLQLPRFLLECGRNREGE
jgi:hypothetical protein